jgi:hypothetical protein
MKVIKFKELFGVEKVEELNERLCRENVCGNKVMTFFSKGKNKILKEMRKSFNEGKDCCVLDECKDIFGVRKIKMVRVESDCVVERIDKKVSIWKDNMVLKKKKCVYLVMDNFENLGSLVGKKELEDVGVMMESLKIMLFRGIFRVSDGNYTNMLINKENDVLSIDENNIGNRKRIFYKGFRMRNYSLDDLDFVLCDLMSKKSEKIGKIVEVMKEYGFLGDVIDKVVSNYGNLRKDVMDDVDFFWKGVFEKEKEKVKGKRDIRVFGSRCYNGEKVDLVKSCVQKYVRRCNFDKGVYFLIEMDLFKGFEMEKNGKMVNGKGVRSNMRNRLLIMLGEDICFNDYKVWMKVSFLLDKWESLRYEDGIEDRKYLINLYKILCDSKGSRMCSYLRGFYSYGVKVKKVREKYKEEYKGVVRYKRGYGRKYYVDGDDEKLKKYIDGFVRRFDEKSDFVFYWFFKIMEFKGSVGRRKRRSKSMFVIVDIIEKFLNMEKLKGNGINCGKMEKLKDVCVKWVINNNNSRNEGWLWLMCLVKFIMNRDEIDWGEKIDYGLEVGDEEIEKLYLRNLGMYKMDIDNFCIDMHCKEGRDKGSGRKFFVENGAMIVNENLDMLVDVYKKVYEEKL